MIKSENIELFEELEQENCNEQIIEKRKKHKKPNSRNKKCFLFFILIIIIIPIICILFNIDGIKNNNNERNDKEKEIHRIEKNKTRYELKLNHIINFTNDKSGNNIDKKKFPIQSLSIFPSGNMISADWISIHIYDNTYNIIQKINVHQVAKNNSRSIQKKIRKIAIKDDNNFLIYSNDNILKIYTKYENTLFFCKQIIPGAYDAIFDFKGRLVIWDINNIIKIYEEDAKGIYMSIKALDRSRIYNMEKSINKDGDYHLNVLDDKKILVSRDKTSMLFYNVSENYKIICGLKENSMYELESLNDNKIMVYYNNTLKIYGLNVLKVYEIIQTIEVGFEVYSIKYCKEIGVILVGGIDKILDKSVLCVLKSDNYEILKVIYDLHGHSIKGIYILDNDWVTTVATYGDDQIQGYPIKIWDLYPIWRLSECEYIN